MIKEIYCEGFGFTKEEYEELELDWASSYSGLDMIEYIERHILDEDLEEELEERFNNRKKQND